MDFRQLHPTSSTHSDPPPYSATMEDTAKRVKIIDQNKNHELKVMPLRKTHNMPPSRVLV